jgi:hypothetical protein
MGHILPPGRPIIDHRREYRWTGDDNFTYRGFMDKGDGEFRNMRTAGLSFVGSQRA